TITAYSTAAAVSFADDEAANQYLHALRDVPYVSAACVYATNGAPFVKYFRDGPESSFNPPPLQTDGFGSRGSRLYVFGPIVNRGDRCGTLYLEADLDELYRRLWQYAGIVMVLMAGSLLAAFALSAGLVRVISVPILHLAETAAIVATQKNYSVR